MKKMKKFTDTQRLNWLIVKSEKFSYWESIKRFWIKGILGARGLHKSPRAAIDAAIRASRKKPKRYNSILEMTQDTLGKNSKVAKGLEKLIKAKDRSSRKAKP